MDKYQKQRDELAQRIRTLETEWLPSGLSDGVFSMIDELDLVPVTNKVPVTSPRLVGEDVISILQDLGYDCKEGDGYVGLRTEDGYVQVNYTRLPILSVTNGFRLQETEEGLASITKAAAEVTHDWDMVKAIISSRKEHLLIYLQARHADLASFSDSIQFYIEQVIGATRNLREAFNNYERERMLSSFRNTLGIKTLS